MIAARDEQIHGRHVGSLRVQSPAVSAQRLEVASSLIAFLRDYAERRLNAGLADARRCLPPHVVLDFGRRGLFGLRVPRDLGGIDLGWRAGSPVFEQLAAIDLTLAMMVGIHNELGIGPILRWGSATAKEELLPGLAGGRMLGGLAITERGAGSNPHAISSTAVPQPGGAWRVSGEKILVGNGSWAGVINVFARRADENGPRGLIGFAVPTESAGVHMGPEMMTMGMRGIVQNRVRFDDVLVDGTYLLGSADGNFEVAEDTFRMARLGLTVAATGAMKRCAQLMIRFVSRRRVWTGPLDKNPVLCGVLRTILDSVQVLTRLSSRIFEALDEEKQVPAELYFVCKILGPEYLWFAADNLVQWLGGRGYLESNEAPRIMRDARLLRIFEGPTEAMTVQLGSMWQAGAAPLKSFVASLAGGECVLRKTAAACDEIWAAPTPVGLSLGQHAFSRRHGIGVVVASGVAWALAGDPASPPDLARRMRRRFEDTHRTELYRAIGAAPLDLSSVGEELAHEIGDVVQLLPGEDWAVDDLLAPVIA